MRLQSAVLTSPRLRGEVEIRVREFRVRGTSRVRGVENSSTSRARGLRKKATDAEAALWQKLRSRSLNGFKFVRQEPIGPYTIDFVCREERLIIEVDGGQHADNPHDVVRDRWLTARNYRVMRFWNNDVLTNMAGVLEVIATALAEAPPHPDR
jgi:very-short-patch-repair endonuclease